METTSEDGTRGAYQKTVQGYNNCMVLPSRERQEALTHVEVYLDNFIGVVQGISYKWKYMMHNLCRSLDTLFRTNNPLDVAREEPISLKKLAKVYAQCITRKTVLGWSINTAQPILALPITWREKLEGSLAAIFSRAARV